MISASCFSDPLAEEKSKIAPVALAGSDQTTIPGALVYLDGSYSYDPDGKVVLYKWAVTDSSWNTRSVTSPLLSRDDVASPVLLIPTNADDGDTIDLHLTVTDDSGQTAVDNVTITVEKTVTLNSLGQYKDILFAAYAGIASESPGSGNDVPVLYKVMIDDLNRVSMEMADSMVTGLELSEYYDLLVDGKEIDVIDEEHDTDDELLYRTTLTMKAWFDTLWDQWNLIYTFNGSLVIDVNEFIPDSCDCIYTGASSSDITVKLQGEFELNVDYEVKRFEITSVSISAADTLQASYDEASVDVSYGGWEINYSVSEDYNRGILPDSLYWEEGVTLSDNDNRDYTVTGSFRTAYTTAEEVERKSYRYLSGFRYRQYEPDSGDIILSVNGTLETDESGGAVVIASTYNTSNPTSYNSITRNAGGLLNSGAMTINGTAMNVDFYVDSGTDTEIADFSGSNSELTGTESNWQTSLDPHN
jgi:hypothetical protein